jgi:glycerophosphoryl diester phosphodiesterase
LRSPETSLNTLGWLTARPVAHRGLHDDATGVIENMLPAIRAAVESGYAIEIDVQPSSDGEAMVFHDATLDRLVHATGAVSARSSAELQLLPFRRAPEVRIPRLAEATEAIAGRVPLVIEIKSDPHRDDTLERRIVSLLESYRGPVAVMSFDPRSIVAMRELAPTLPRGIISMRYDNDATRQRIPARYRFMLRHLLHAAHTRPDFVAYEVHGLPAPGPLVLKHVFGRPLLSWTVRTPAERQKAERWADQIIFEGFKA